MIKELKGKEYWIVGDSKQNLELVKFNLVTVLVTDVVSYKFFNEKRDLLSQRHFICGGAFSDHRSELVKEADKAPDLNAAYLNLDKLAKLLTKGEFCHLDNFRSHRDEPLLVVVGRR